MTHPLGLKGFVGFGQDLLGALDGKSQIMEDAGNMGGMIRDRKFLLNDSAHHRASPNARGKTIGDRTAFQNIGKVSPLAFGQLRGPARPMPLQNSVHAVVLPSAQPETNLGSMNFKSVGDFRSRFSLHVEGHGVDSAGHAVKSVPKGLFAEADQVLNLFCCSMNLYRAHVTSPCR